MMSSKISEKDKSTKSRSRSSSRGRQPAGRRSRSPSRSRKAKSLSPSKVAPRHRRSRDPTPTRVSQRLIALQLHKQEETVAQETANTNGDVVGVQSPAIILENHHKPPTPTSKPASNPTVSENKTEHHPKPVSSNFCLPRLLAAFLLVCLPLCVLTVNLMARKPGSLRWPFFPRRWSFYLDYRALLVVAGWFLFQAVLACLPLGRLVEVPELRPGWSVRHRCNGLACLVITLLVFSNLLYAGWVSVTWLYTRWVALITAATVGSFLLAIWAYFKARRAAPGTIAISSEGNTGYFLPDIMMGREVNPRLPGSCRIDLKLFCQSRIGLIGWLILEIIICLHHWDKALAPVGSSAGDATASTKNRSSALTIDGATTTMLFLLTGFHSLYIIDRLLFEEALVYSLEMTRTGFGFLSSFTSFLVYPFLHTLVVRFMAENQVSLAAAAGNAVQPESQQSLSWIAVLSVPTVLIYLLVQLVGYTIYRVACSQRLYHVLPRYLNHPQGAGLSTIPGRGGKKLLCGGWWGRVRHPDHLGYLVMTISWCLPAGFSHALPWVYCLVAVGTILFVHVPLAESLAKKEYGVEAWINYCRQTPYRIIPKIY